MNKFILETSQWIGFKWGHWYEIMRGPYDTCNKELQLRREKIPYNRRWRIIQLIEEIGE